LKVWSNEIRNNNFSITVSDYFMYGRKRFAQFFLLLSCKEFE
jgi:hypothetical protein